MEFEKAIKIADSHDSGSDFWSTVRKALEKQIPKKPIPYEDGWLYWKCPCCSLSVGENMAYKIPTCYCGQRLDWSEDE